MTVTPFHRMLCASGAYLQACAKDASGPKADADADADAHAHGGTEANVQAYDVPSYVWGIPSSAGQQVREARKCPRKSVRTCEDGCVARMARVHVHRHCVCIAA